MGAYRITPVRSQVRVLYRPLEIRSESAGSAHIPIFESLVICATLAGIAGAYIGNKLLKKVTLKFLQVTVAIMLIIISILLGGGLI